MSDALTVQPASPGLVTELATTGAQWSKGAQDVGALVVNSQESYQRAAAFCRMAKGEYDKLEIRRTKITKPLLESKREVDDLFRPSLTALKMIEAELKSKMGAYVLATEAERKQVMVESAAQHAAGAIPTAVVPEPPAASGVGVRETWDFEIVDAKMVPRHYCSPDPAIIREALSVAGDLLQIPGIKITKRAAISVRK